MTWFRHTDMLLHHPSIEQLLDRTVDEASGNLDWNSELELWTRAGHIKVKLNKGIDVRRLDNLLAHMALHSH